MLGKTFKGMTDEMLAWQTERFLGLETATGRATSCTCAPNRSSRSRSTACSARRCYPGGIALRFARVVRYRDDKPVPEQVDDVATILARPLLRAARPLAHALQLGSCTLRTMAVMNR